MSVARHTAYNLVGAILPIGVTLVTVPLYLKAIGLERYGVLALVWVLAGYFAFFDFGIGRATARKMATLNEASPDARNRLFWTSAAITCALALVATLIFWPVASLFVARMQIPALLRPELTEALPLLVAAVPVGILQSLLGGTLDGRRAFGTINAIGIVGNLLTAILPLASAWTFGPRLSLLIAATLLVRGAVLVAQVVACRSIVPLGRAERTNNEDARALLTFGGWATVTGIVGPLLVYVDRFAIGAWLGAAAVGFYVIGYNLISQMQVVPGAFARAIFPRLAELSPDESRGRSTDALRVMTAVVTPMTLSAILAMTPFLHLWLGAEISTTTGPVTVILLIGFWMNSIAFIAFARLQSMGRPDHPAKVHFGELLPYAALLIGGIMFAGLRGAAAAWTIRCAADLLLLTYLAGLLSDARRVLAIGALLVAGAAVIALCVITPFLYWPLAVLLVIVSSGWAWSIVPLHLRSTILTFTRHPLQFRKPKA